MLSILYKTISHFPSKLELKNVSILNPLNANPTKWSNHFVGLTILWGWLNLTHAPALKLLKLISTFNAWCLIKCHAYFSKLAAYILKQACKFQHV